MSKETRQQSETNEYIEAIRKFQEEVVDSGIFDKIPHPSDGYVSCLNKAVLGKDGIIYGLRALLPEEKVLLEGKNEEKIIKEIDFIRPGSQVIYEIIVQGLVTFDTVICVNEKLEIIPSPQGLSHKHN